MAFESNFAQILEEKLKKEDVSIGDSPQKKEKNSNFPPVRPSFFLNSFQWNPKKVGKLYRKKRPNKQKTPPPLPKKETKIQVANDHLQIKELSQQGQNHILQLIAWGASIDTKHIDTNDIKKAYKQLVKKFHPDLDRSGQFIDLFLRLQEIYPVTHTEVVNQIKSKSLVQEKAS